MSTLVVGISDCKMSSDQDAVLTTYALGSCIAVAVYDPAARIGGLLLEPSLENPDSVVKQNTPCICDDVTPLEDARQIFETPEGLLKITLQVN